MRQLTLGDIATIKDSDLLDIVGVETALIARALDVSVEQVESLPLGTKWDEHYLELKQQLLDQPEMSGNNMLTLRKPIGQIKVVKVQQTTLKHIKKLKQDSGYIDSIDVVAAVCNLDKENAEQMSIQDAFAVLEETLPLVLIPGLIRYLLGLRVEWLGGMP